MRLTRILGWGPRLWRGTDLLRSLDKAPFDCAQDRRDGEPVESTGGGSRPRRDRPSNGSIELFARLSIFEEDSS